jgi:hypothetical protein
MSLSSAFSNVNVLAVLVAGIIHMATGLVWYQPRLFGTKWSALTGKDLNPAKQWLLVGAVGHIVIALVLAIIVNLANTTTVFGGLVCGILVWLGFIVTLEIGELIWEKIPFTLFLIRIGEHLVSLGLAGIILAVWR